MRRMFEGENNQLIWRDLPLLHQMKGKAGNLDQEKEVL